MRVKAGGCAWKALDAKGDMHEGVWEMSDISLTRSLLLKCGYYPVSIRMRRPLRTRRRAGDARQMWSGFVWRLSALLEAGIPLLNALEIIVVQEESLTAKAIWQGIRDKVSAGNDLSMAFIAFDSRLPVFAQAMIRAGEKSGDLAAALASLAVELEQERKFARKIQGALSYPIFLACTALGVVYAMGIWVLPVYERLFGSLQADLPMLTLFIFGFARALPALSAVLTGLPFVLLIYVKARYRREWRAQLRHWRIHVPLVGRVYRLRELLHFCQVMGMLLQAGVTLDEALKPARETAESKEMSRLIGRLKEGVCQGRRVAPILQADGLFPAAAREMLGVAEEAGQWDRMFQHVAGMLRTELEELLERIARVLEPALLVGLAGVIGALAVGILLPVFDVSTHLQ